MKHFRRISFAVFIILLCLASANAQTVKKDYLSDYEADKIRDAETPNERIKLFVQFADERLKKFQYIQEGIEKQQNVRAGVDLMANKAKEFLETLKKISADAKELDLYKLNLDDAIEGTQDAVNDAEKAKKSVAPPPTRRKN